MIFRRKTRAKTIEFTPIYGKHLYDITSLIELTIDSTSKKDGLVNLHVQSSKAALMIQENGESQLKKDFMFFFQKLLSSYMQDNTLIENTNDARLMASIIGPNKTIPISNGKLALSEDQRVFFCEFDQSNIKREIIITFLLN